jgi:hypothetical protein
MDIYIDTCCLQYGVRGQAEGIKIMGVQQIPLGKEVFPRVILGTRAIISLVLVVGSLPSLRSPDLLCCLSHYCLGLAKCIDVMRSCPSVCLPSIAQSVVVLVLGAYQHCSNVGLFYSNPPMEFRHSSPEALHTKRRERPLLAKDETKARKFI